MLSALAKGKRRWRAPIPLLYLVLLARLSGSPFLATAQYIDTRLGAAGRGSRGAHVGTRRDQSSYSRSIWVESYDDFCLFGPPEPFEYIWSSGLNVVSWCSKAGHDARLIPDGTIQGVTFVRTGDWVQVSGFGDFTKINIAPGDAGGQFDSETHTPEGAQVTVNGQAAASWVTLISSDAFCMRACTGDPAYCPSTYDQMGCWLLTGNAVGPSGTYQNCEADSGDPPGVVDGQTYTQPTPEPVSPELRNCQPGGSISNGQAAPPMQTWNGQPNEGAGSNPSPDSGSATSGTASADADAQFTGETSSGTKAGESDGSPARTGASTTWLPVETCAPCEQDANAVPSANSSFSSSSGATTGGTTEQVGVTQVSPPEAGAALLTSAEGGSTTPSSTSTPKATPAPAHDELSRRQAGDSDARGGGDEATEDGTETTTKDGQCCYTTWTPSVIGASPTGTSTGTSTSGSSLSTSGANATSASSNHTSSRGSLGGVTPSGTLHVGGAGPAATANSSARISGGLGTGSNSTNGTSRNGTGNGSGAGLKAEIVGMEGVWRVMVASCVAVGLAAALGGWSLV